MRNLNHAFAAVATASAASAAALGSYNVDPSSVSVSGISAGGFMSVQLGVAYSDVFATGFGVFAGGPFDCARDQSVSNPCSPRPASPHPNMCFPSTPFAGPTRCLQSRSPRPT
jgi:poly(3-hydroxybutyrate) depolymerase